MFFHFLSHPYAIQLKREKKKSSFRLRSEFELGRLECWGTKFERSCQNVLIPQVLIIGVLFKPSHCSLSIFFPLCLRGMAILGCQILEILESDKRHTKSLTSHFCKFCLCISQDSLYSKASCIGLYHSLNRSFLQLIDRISNNGQKIPLDSKAISI